MNIIGYDPETTATDTPQWATEQDVDTALRKAHTAWQTYRQTSGEERATFLRAIADNIEALGDELVETVMAESNLPQGRVVGERGRTCGQLRLFADLVAEGNWVEATIDTGDPDRTPAAKPDIRRMNIALGPVVVFTASNFPLAFSTAGGDTTSALAAGCPVIVKAHEGHLRTNALVATAIRDAAQDLGLPDGVFSSLQGKDYTLGRQLVQHSHTRAVAFTGSLRGGKALYDLAQQREHPIPVFAEMGSINPIFLLPETMAEEAEQWGETLAQSICLGVGQFCTNPGLLIAIDDAATERLLSTLLQQLSTTVAAKMLHPGILDNYHTRRQRILQNGKVTTLFTAPQANPQEAQAAFATVNAIDFLRQPELQEEVFGPFSLLVKCANLLEMEHVARALHGQLTATLIGSPTELARHDQLIDLLEEKVGRLLFNGVPTGVEVGYAMQHGGPYPATTDGRFTSVGTAAIRRFARPIAYQDCPPTRLPAALQDGNPLSIWRTINGQLTTN